MADLLPITVLTGYLGAGKTTLLNRILTQNHGRRYAVLMNEFGEVGIDGDLVAGSSGGLIEMSNGCVCCTVRGDLLRTMHKLLAGDTDFDAIVLETTGLADPAPVALTLLADDVVQARCRLDSVTTLVDAALVLRRLQDSPEATRQIAFADQIVLNKQELASEPALAAIEQRLRSLNPLAPITRATRADVDLDALLHRGGFDLDRIQSVSPGPGAGPATRTAAGTGHDHAHVHDENCAHGSDCAAAADHHSHQHHAAEAAAHDHIAAGGIASVSLVSERPMDFARLSSWVDDLLMTQGDGLLRAKGIIAIAGDERRLVIQAVQHLFEGDFGRPWHADELRASRLVLIGRNLDRQVLASGFAACAA